MSWAKAKTDTNTQLVDTKVRSAERTQVWRSNKGNSPHKRKLSAPRPGTACFPVEAIRRYECLGPWQQLTSLLPSKAILSPWRSCINMVSPRTLFTIAECWYQGRVQQVRKDTDRSYRVISTSLLYPPSTHLLAGRDAVEKGVSNLTAGRLLPRVCIQLWQDTCATWPWTNIFS